MDRDKLIEIERGIAMLRFLTLGTTLTMVDIAVKNEIEKQDDAEFPREMEGSKGWIKLYKNHNAGFSFGVLKGSRAVELIPLCITSGIAGAWAYLMSVRGHVTEKLALTLVLAGGVSNLFDRLTRGYVVDYFSIQWKKLKKVVFNLGDIFIFAGSFLLVALQIVDAFLDIIHKNK